MLLPRKLLLPGLLNKTSQHRVYAKGSQRWDPFFMERLWATMGRRKRESVGANHAGFPDDAWGKERASRRTVFREVGAPRPPDACYFCFAMPCTIVCANDRTASDVEAFAFVAAASSGVSTFAASAPSSCLGSSGATAW